MMKVLKFALIAALVAGCFAKRSLWWMRKLAGEEYADHMNDIGVDTSGFSGPNLSLSQNRLRFTWEKTLPDLSALSMSVLVGEYRFTKIEFVSTGPNEAWRGLAEHHSKHL
jgi:hypothetical protein